MPVTKLAVAGWFSAAAVVTGASVAGLYGLAPTAASSGNNGNGNGNTSNSGHPITISGIVAGVITPGSPANLNVKISNPNNQDLVVTQVSGTISSVTSAGIPGRPACSAGWFSVGSFSGSQPVGKNGGSVTLPVPITLSNLTTTNQDNCKGTIVRFAFTATAQQA